MNIQEALKCASQLISDSARLDVELILAHVLGESRTYLFTWPEALLSQQQQNYFLQLLERRKQGEPVAYILGEQEFWSLTLRVNNSTLIPRPETELLVELAIEKLQRIAQPSILDLGTGTGAIALAIASELKLANKHNVATVDAVDSSGAAVNLAQHNAALNNLAWVRVFKSHWFEHVTEQYQVIVSNPPYIDAADPHLNEGDVRFEPASALVADEDGLADIREIIQHSQQYLKPSGVLMLEHGWQQAAAVRQWMNDANFMKVQSVKDLNGIERVTLGELCGE